MTELPRTLAAKRDCLLTLLRRYGGCAVAFSGGVDSAVVAKAAQLALGNNVILVTGISASLAGSELQAARELAAMLGIRHIEIATTEFSNPNYTANAPDRCYHCKNELYDQVDRIAAETGMQVVVNGANADDLEDYRPGMRAAAEHRVRSPLAECGITKQEVRQLAAAWQLPIADKPATPCLSSRVAYGQRVTPERLAMIGTAEQFLRSLGFSELRVRYHGDDLARIEVPVEDLQRLFDGEIRQAIVEEFERLGFKFTTLDLAGFRSGSFHRLIPPEQIAQLS